MKVKILEKMIEYGLYLLVFLLPVQTRWIIKAGSLNGGYWEYGTYSLYATDILLIIILLFFTLAQIFIYKFSIFNFQFSIKSKINIIWLLVFVLLIISAVSVFFAPDKVLALFKLGWLILGMGLFWLMVSAEYDKLKLIYFMLAGIFLQAVLGIWQFLTQASFANKWLGMALHRAQDLGTSVVETVGADGVGERWLRAYGGLDHPNILGGVLVIGILLVVYLIIWRNKYLPIFNPSLHSGQVFQFSIFNKIQNFKSQIQSIILWCFLIISFIGLLFTFSRGAWLALMIGILLCLIMAVVKKDLKVQKILLEIILVWGIIFFIIFNQYQNLFITRVGANGRLEIKSNQERLASYQEAWQIIKDDWLVGVGVGNYTLAGYNLKQKDCEIIKIAESKNLNCALKNSWDFQPTHNTFLLVWAEIGIVGLILLLILLFWILLEIGNWKLEIRDKKFNLNYILKICLLVIIIILMAFDHWPWSLHFGVLFFWLLAGLVARRNVNFIVDTEIKGS